MLPNRSQKWYGREYHSLLCVSDDELPLIFNKYVNQQLGVINNDNGQ